MIFKAMQKQLSCYMYTQCGKKQKITIYTVWKNEFTSPFTVTVKMFREINSLVKTLLSRIFVKWCRRTVWKNENFNLTKNFFRQINSFVISLVNALLSRNFCWWSMGVNFRNFYTVSHLKEFREIISLYNFLVEKLISRNFCYESKIQ